MALHYRSATLPDRWPGERTLNRKPSPFKSNWGDTLSLLESEVRHVGGRDVVLRLDVTDRDIKLDGGVRADARLRSPAVVLELRRGKDLLSFPCDRFNYWQDNVRAIALVMEALRKIDRYGVRAGNQYIGFKALPGAGESTTTMDVARAVRIIAEHSDHTAEGIVTSVVMARVAVRTAAGRTHSDRAGSTEAFQLVQTARKVLTDHFGETI